MGRGARAPSSGEVPERFRRGVGSAAAIVLVAFWLPSVGSGALRPHCDCALSARYARIVGAHCLRALLARIVGTHCRRALSARIVGAQGAMRSSREQPRGAMSSQEQPGAARSSQEQPGAAKSSEEQPGAAKSSQTSDDRSQTPMPNTGGGVMGVSPFSIDNVPISCVHMRRRYAECLIH